MKLNELSPQIGSKKRPKRIGRGESSGWGKSAGRGGNGQKARRGASIPAYFEGGQTPFTKRIPKRGFTNFDFREKFSIVNLGTLNDRFIDGDKVDKDILIAKGIIKKDYKLKILGKGNLEKKLIVVADKFSNSAKEKIEALQGTAEVINAQ